MNLEAAAASSLRGAVVMERGRSDARCVRGRMRGGGGKRRVGVERGAIRVGQGVSGLESAWGSGCGGLLLLLLYLLLCLRQLRELLDDEGERGGDGAELNLQPGE